MFNVLPTDHVLCPRELHPGVSTPYDYLRAQAQAIRSKQLQFPHLNWQLPWLYVGEPVSVKVSSSCWQLICSCGNYPLYDPEWQLACCYTCGAVYRQPPPDAWQEIERLLVLRPLLHTRNWLPEETPDD